MRVKSISINPIDGEFVKSIGKKEEEIWVNKAYCISSGYEFQFSLFTNKTKNRFGIYFDKFNSAELPGNTFSLDELEIMYEGIGKLLERNSCTIKKA